MIQFDSMISLEIHKRVKHLYEKLKQASFQGIVGVTPAYSSIVVYYERKVISFYDLKTLIDQYAATFSSAEDSNFKVILPVCYEGDFALDLKKVCEHTGLLESEVIQLHTESLYLIYMIGFVPGFMYLGGMNDKLKTPRLQKPRLTIPKGSVGIADQQTGVYPLSTPGGWQIIGNCPLNLLSFNTSERVQMGDYVQFEPISRKMHEELLGKTPKRIRIK